MTKLPTTSLSEETLSRARERALDLTQPLCRITDCADRTDVLADELLRLASRARALARDLRGTSVSQRMNTFACCWNCWATRRPTVDRDHEPGTTGATHATDLQRRCKLNPSE